MELQTLTGEQMQEYAYKRNIAIGEAHLKLKPKPVYDSRKLYYFGFDKGQPYKWIEPTLDGGDIFIRQTDEGRMYFSKYSHMSNI